MATSKGTGSNIMVSPLSLYPAFKLQSLFTTVFANDEDLNPDVPVIINFLRNTIPLLESTFGDRTAET